MIAIAVATSGLAGCLAGGPPNGDGPGEVGDGVGAPAGRLPSAYAYACPAGETATRPDGLCFGTVASTTESLQEPFLALDPSRPEVIAVGVNGGHSTDTVTLQGSTVRASPFRLDVYISKDAGETWRRIDLPPIGAGPGDGSIDATVTFDPALTFDDEGVLHVSGIFRPQVPGLTCSADPGACGAFHVLTPDLGDSWSEPRLFLDRGWPDRNWIAVGSEGLVLVPWQVFGQTDGQESGSLLAWSVDGGASWDVLEAQGGLEDCFNPAVSVRSGVVVLACAVEGAIRFLHFEPESRALAVVSEVPFRDALIPLLASSSDGTLVLAVRDLSDLTVYVAASRDAGATWGEAVDAREMTELDDAWARATAARWLTGDPWGGIHLLWGGTECAQSPPGEPGDAACPDGLIHIAFDPDTLTSITATELASATPAEHPPRVPPSLGPPQGDHFHGIAFGPEHGVLAWTRDKGIDHTVVVPVR